MADARMILVDHNYSRSLHYGHQVPKEKQKFKEVGNQQLIASMQTCCRLARLESSIFGVFIPGMLCKGTTSADTTALL